MCYWQRFGDFIVAGGAVHAIFAHWNKTSCASRLAAVAREHGSLAKLATKYRRFRELIDELAEAQEMVDGDDPDMRELAEAEIPELKSEREVIWSELLDQWPR